MDRHVQSLGQKYMGYRPSSSYQDTSIKPEGGHNVLIDNFMNAQCKHPVSTFYHRQSSNTILQTLIEPNTDIF